VQYDCPGTVKDYIHRVGRTARAGKMGKSLLLLSAHEAGYVEVLNEHKIFVKQVKYQKCLEKLRNVSKACRICFINAMPVLDF
jgi:ATP-dependent RNA helicase DDX18/HAS1